MYMYIVYICICICIYIYMIKRTQFQKAMFLWKHAVEGYPMTWEFIYRVRMAVELPCLITQGSFPHWSSLYITRSPSWLILLGESLKPMVWHGRFHPASGSKNMSRGRIPGTSQFHNIKHPETDTGIYFCNLKSECLGSLWACLNFRSTKPSWLDMVYQTLEHDWWRNHFYIIRYNKINLFDTPSIVHRIVLWTLPWKLPWNCFPSAGVWKSEIPQTIIWISVEKLWQQCGLRHKTKNNFSELATDFCGKPAVRLRGTSFWEIAIESSPVPKVISGAPGPRLWDFARPAVTSGRLKPAPWNISKSQGIIMLALRMEHCSH